MSHVVLHSFTEDTGAIWRSWETGRIAVEVSACEAATSVSEMTRTTEGNTQGRDNPNAARY